MRGIVLGLLTVMLVFVAGGLIIGFITTGNAALGWAGVFTAACAAVTLWAWESRGG